MRALAVVLLLTACAPPRMTAEAGVLQISESEQTSSFIRNFNPLLEVGDMRWPTLHAMYEPLLIFNPLISDYVPWLASAYRWDGEGKLIFTIRDGVAWSDGVPFDANDVVFTFELMRRSEALDLRGVWRFVDAVRAVDAHTVEFSFKRPYVPGLYYIAQQPIVPAHIWKDVVDPVTFTNEHPVATGPFTEVAWFRSQAYQVDRNPHYWQPGKPAVKSLRFIALPANDQTILAMIDGELDWAGNFVPAIDRVYVGKNPAHHHYWFPLIDGMVMLYANTTVAPYGDVRVRKALSMAIDRELIVEVAMHGYTRPADATALCDAYDKFRNPDAVTRGDWVAHDVARAGALLDEAGLPRGKDGWRRLPDGSRWSIQLIVPAGFSDWVLAAQVIARGLRAAGVDAQLRAYDYNAWYEKVQQGEFDLTLGWTELGPTPYGLYRSLMSSETRKPTGEMAVENWHRFALPEADALLARLETTLDPDEEMRLTLQLEDLFVANAPAIPLFPGPLWGQFNDERFTGFPSQDDPYAALSPHWYPQSLLVITQLEPR